MWRRVARHIPVPSFNAGFRPRSRKLAGITFGIGVVPGRLKSAGILFA